MFSVILLIDACYVISNTHANIHSSKKHLLNNTVIHCVVFQQQKSNHVQRNKYQRTVANYDSGVFIFHISVQFNINS